MCKKLLICLAITLIKVSGSFSLQGDSSASDKEKSDGRESRLSHSSEHEEKSYAFARPLPPTLNRIYITPKKQTPRREFHLTSPQRRKLAEAGISEKELCKIEVLQTALLRSPHGHPLIAESYFTYDEISKIRSVFGAQHSLYIRILSLKSIHPIKIPSQKITQQILTPAARLASSGTILTRSRSIIGAIAASSASDDLVRVTANLFAEDADDAVETHEERLQRLNTQTKLFKALEENRGILDADRTQQLTQIEQAWQSYLQYLTLRTEAIANSTGVGNKITCKEIEDVFETYLSSVYTKIDVNGCTLCINPQEVHLDRTNFSGETNKDLLTRKVAPIGADGNPMNLHHLTRRHPGVVVLMTESFHQKYTDLLHLRSEKIMRQPNPVDRVIFSRWKIDAFTAIKQALESVASK